ncbi:MAG: hypothetical protein WBC29_02185 [Candidatus Moraniibacteriota bacterium]
MPHDILPMKVHFPDTDSSASQFWNPKEKFHFLFFEQKARLIDFLIADLSHSRQASILSKRLAKKLFEFPL